MRTGTIALVIPVTSLGLEMPRLVDIFWIGFSTALHDGNFNINGGRQAPSGSGSSLRCLPARWGSKWGENMITGLVMKMTYLSVRARSLLLPRRLTRNGITANTRITMAVSARACFLETLSLPRNLRMRLLSVDPLRPRNESQDSSQHRPFRLCLTALFSRSKRRAHQSPLPPQLARWQRHSPVLIPIPQ